MHKFIIFDNLKIYKYNIVFFNYINKKVVTRFNRIE